MLGFGIGVDHRLRGDGAAIDTTPTAFSFTDQTNVSISSTITSDAITVLGTNESTAVTITGGTYSRNGGAYTAAAGLAYPGDIFTVRHTSSASGQTAVNTVLTIGGVSDTFTSTTADVTAPTITSSASASVEENAVLAHALTANEAVTWTITAGADAARFEISGSTLRWAANGTKDFEAPDDANTDNAYIVQVTATDAALNATNQTVTVTVTDVVEGPPPNLYPDPDLEAELDYVCTGSCAKDTGQINFSDSGLGDGYTVTITGTTLTALNAALSDSTTYQVSVNAEGTEINGITQIRLKTGTFVNLGIATDGWTTPVPVTTGVGLLNGLNGSDCTFQMLDIRITI